MVEVARASGAPTAHLVENAAGIDPAWLAGVRTVGLSSGASVPEVLVGEVVAWLAEHGYADVEEITHTEERLTFALPRELRRDLRAASGG
jgi:4-hydroxy-3-methylbut-2-enyl diphosphate reductase